MDVVELLIKIYIPLIMVFLFSYLKEKGKNRALAEDLEKITQNTEEIKCSYLQIIENYKSINSLNSSRLSEYNSMKDSDLFTFIEDLNSFYFKLYSIEPDDIGFSFEKRKEWKSFLEEVSVNLFRVEFKYSKVKAFFRSEVMLLRGLEELMKIVLMLSTTLYEIDDVLRNSVVNEAQDMSYDDKAEYINLFHNELEKYLNLLYNTTEEFRNHKTLVFEYVEDYYEVINLNFTSDNTPVS